MSKRRPGSQLTQDNWDEEDEDLEAGTFTAASAETIKGRQIKKAKRRGLPSAGDGEEGGSAFKAFTGFAGFGAATGGAKPAFAFNVGGASKPDSQQTNGTKDNAAKTDSEPIKSAASPGRSEYLSQLRSLNESVSKWVASHVQKNPYCILSPIFSDYQAHLSKLEKLDPERTTSQAKSGGKHEQEAEKADSKSSDSAVKPADKPAADKPASDKPAAGFAGGFTFSSTASADKPATTAGFSFSSTTDAEKPATTGGFTFGAGSTGSTFGGSSGSGGGGIFGSKPAADSGAGASGSAGFSFAVSKPAAAPSGADKEEEEYVPPKEEVKAVVEDDAFYTKRCKLFFKKGEAWQDKGVGNLHLKPCDGKTQLLIRADTNLGNVLLNILLGSRLPANRQGKNNVMLVCVPNPPVDEKNPDDKTAVSMLIRVKTGSDADELLDKIKEAKAASS